MKNKVILALFFIFIFTAAFIGGHELYKVNSPKNIVISSLPPSNTEDTEPIDDGNLTASAPVKKEPIIYDILGESNKLTEKEKVSRAKWAADLQQFARKYQDDVFINGQTKEKLVALTFDDGPDATNTPKVLDILKKYNVKGNFFFIGEQAKRYPDVVRRAFIEGNLVLSHSYTHADLSTKDEVGIYKEILSTENELYDLIGKKPAMIRPPYGSINEKVISEAKRSDDKLIIWSIDTLDWSQKEKGNITKNVIDNVRPGDIVLMHCNEDKKSTVEALPLIITALNNNGYKIVTLEELLGVKAYK